jgi:Rieske Fe-S protein
MKAPLPATRRNVITGAGAGFVVAVTAACSGTDSYVAPGDGSGAPTEVAIKPIPGAVGDPNAEASAGAGAAAPVAKLTPLASLNDIPVGSAISAKDPKGNPIILSHPATGQVACFTAICTHQGCTVAPKGASLDCPCHGAKFNAATGAVTNGPATAPLKPLPIHMDGTNIMPGKKQA